MLPGSASPPAAETPGCWLCCQLSWSQLRPAHAALHLSAAALQPERIPVKPGRCGVMQFSVVICLQQSWCFQNIYKYERCYLVRSSPAYPPWQAAARWSCRAGDHPLILECFAVLCAGSHAHLAYSCCCLLGSELASLLGCLQVCASRPGHHRSNRYRMKRLGEQPILYTILQMCPIHQARETSSACVAPRPIMICSGRPAE